MGMSLIRFADQDSALRFVAWCAAEGYARLVAFREEAVYGYPWRVNAPDHLIYTYRR